MKLILGNFHKEMIKYRNYNNVKFVAENSI